MFRNYLRVALRHLSRSKGFSFINLFGLAVGMACFILILLFVRSELSYDRFHENAGRIWRVTREWINESGATSLHLGYVAPPIAPLLVNDFPDILQAARIQTPGRMLVARGDRAFLEDRLLFADENLFEVFTFPLLRGDPRTALKEPFSIVVTEAAARKYFGNEDPLGQVLKIDGRLDAKVTGVAREAPRNSHFHFDLIGSLVTLQQLYGRQEFENWGSNNYATYLLLPGGYPAAKLEAQLPAFLDRHQGPDAHTRNRLHLQRLTDIHLRSHLDSEIETNSDIATVYVFTAVAVFILLIACVNFMNLSTARSSVRAREVGLRKVVGAERGQLVRQFLGESILTAFLALGLALIMVAFAKPAFAGFVGRDLETNVFRHPELAAGLAAVALAVGLAAGIYPAFVLSSLRPIRMLRGSRGSGSYGGAFRSVLVLGQFAVSIILIVCVGVVTRQLRYAREKKLGFDKDQIVVLDMNASMRSRYDTVREQLLAYPGIVDAAGSRRIPSGRLLDSSGARVLEGASERPAGFRLAFVCVDYAFIGTYRMEMAAGRDFSKLHSSDAREAFIINEKAAREFGWTPDQAVGQGLAYGFGNRKGKIIGVVRDFHFESLRQEIAPLVLFIEPSQYRTISVRIRPRDIPATLAFLQRRWAEWQPGFPFRYSFLDDNFAGLYRAEEKLGQVFLGFSLLAVFIACLGLYGLAAFSAEKRTREIGIRKTLGATMTGIVFMMSRDFTRWVLAANVIAWPVAYLAMRSWLGGFAYHVDPAPAEFVVAGAAVLGVALATVAHRAIRAARTNPADSLRIE